MLIFEGYSDDRVQGYLAEQQQRRRAPWELQQQGSPEACYCGYRPVLALFVGLLGQLVPQASAFACDASYSTVHDNPATKED